LPVEARPVPQGTRNNATSVVMVRERATITPRYTYNRVAGTTASERHRKRLQDLESVASRLKANSAIVALRFPVDTIWRSGIEVQAVNPRRLLNL
jgi:hypothetical protein